MFSRDNDCRLDYVSFEKRGELASIIRINCHWGLTYQMFPLCFVLLGVLSLCRFPERI